MTCLNKLEDLPCEDCGLGFSDYKQFLLHRKYHISLLRSVVTEEILLQEGCPLCFEKYCNKYSDICLENLLGSGRKFTESEEETEVKRVKRCKYYPECDAEFYNSQVFVKHVQKVHNDYKPYACQQCDYDTSVYLELKQHLHVHDGYRMLKCPKCPTEYATKSGLHGHLLLMHKDANIKSYDCSNCGRKFAQKQALERHKKVHLSSETFKCHVCPKEFSHKTTLAEHLKRHKDTNAYTCDICAKPFISKKTLRQHVMTHSGKKQFSCEYCDKKFYRISCRIRHRAIHVDTEPTQCEICGKFYPGKYRLRKHMKVHSRVTDEKLFNCSLCRSKFYTEEVLKNHLLAHEGKQPHACGHCGKRFMSKQTLKKHLKPGIGVDRPLCCNKCPKTFQSKNCLTYHERSHKEEFTCAVCKAKCITQCGLNRHLKIHGITVEDGVQRKPITRQKSERKKEEKEKQEDRFECSHCSKEFRDKQNLQSHLKMKHEGKVPYDCEHCGKGFMRERSVKLHLDPKKESDDLLHCKECSKTFKNINCLTHHTRSHMAGFSCEVCKAKCLSRDGFRRHLLRHELMLGSKRTRLGGKQE